MTTKHAEKAESSELKEIHRFSSTNKFTTDGKAICCLCGFSDHDLRQHVQEKHSISPEQYLERYASEGWSLDGKNFGIAETLSYKDREKKQFSVLETFGFWWGKDEDGKPYDRKVIGYAEAGSLTPKADDGYVFSEEHTRIALMGMHYRDHILTVGPTGCHAKGTLILMFDGSLKPVEQVNVGDQLMGPDSTPRNVLELCHGWQEMFSVQPTKGKAFVVNKHHVLTLVHTKTSNIVDVPLSEYLSWSKAKKYAHKLFRVSVVFPSDSVPLSIDAYSFGKLAHTRPCIPSQYKTASCADRILLLAGLLDTCGSFSKQCYFVSCQNRAMVADVCFVARSLGFAAYPSKHNKNYPTSKDANSTTRKESQGCFRVTISGDIHRIPTLILPRQNASKQNAKSFSHRNVLRTGFTVEPMPVDQYFGFVLDGDHRYVMGDFTVTHNSGKSSLWQQIAARLNYNFVRINFDGGITRSDLVGQWVVKGSTMVFQYGILPSAMALGGTIVCLDEWDAIGEEVSFVLQRPLEADSQLLLLEKGEELVTLHPDNVIVATANTNGMGDDTGLYATGTRIQNYAQINRFNLTILLDYLAPEQEEMILLKRYKEEISPIEAKFMVKVVNAVREAFARGRISAPLSTRDLINWAEKFIALGDAKKAAKYCFVNRMPTEERGVLFDLIERAMA